MLFLPDIIPTIFKRLIDTDARVPYVEVCLHKKGYWEGYWKDINVKTLSSFTANLFFRTMPSSVPRNID